jgi:hypothetical protein
MTMNWMTRRAGASGIVPTILAPHFGGGCIGQSMSRMPGRWSAHPATVTLAMATGRAARDRQPTFM